MDSPKTNSDRPTNSGRVADSLAVKPPTNGRQMAVEVPSPDEVSAIAAKSLG